MRTDANDLLKSFASTFPHLQRVSLSKGGTAELKRIETLCTCCSTDFSSESLGLTSINTPSEVEDADVSSAPLHGS